VQAPGARPVSPRARKLAAAHGIDAAALAGSGPRGRVIVRDVQARLDAGGLQTTENRNKTSRQEAPITHGTKGSPANTVKLAGARRVIAERMLASLQSTAQLTLHASADARMLQDRRARLKATPAGYGLQGISINDLVLYAASRVLARRPDVNALLVGDEIEQHAAVQLGFAVDTPRGLLVPVIRDAHTLTLRALSQQAKALAEAAVAGKITPDALQGGTFTVSNLGAFGVEAFTPVLNAPQVAILGVGNIALKPVQVDDAVQFVPRIGLSLTIDHRALDGAPAARFLAELADTIANVDVL
jgi:pyruvate dehydrogenase E2 component (dihydrolipoamide acetyltransferase)